MTDLPTLTTKLAEQITVTMNGKSQQLSRQEVVKLLQTTKLVKPTLSILPDGQLMVIELTIFEQDEDGR